MHTISPPINSRAESSVLLHSPNLTRQVMSSREIAELTNKQHKDVIRDVRVMQKALEEDGADLRHLTDVKDGRGYTSEFLLDRDLTETLITGYSIALRHKVICRLRELEEERSSVARIPTSLPEALRLAADQAEQNQKLSLVILQQAPKVAAIKRLAAAHGAVCLTDAAKLLQINPRQFIEWMINRNWLYQRGKRKRLAADQFRIDQGLMTHKVTELKANDMTGEVRAVAQPLVTPKGLARLAEMLQEAL